MKLIIDIPEERYKDIKRIASVQLEMRIDTAEQIIANGTPFDSVIEDIITEIKAIQQEDIECDGTSDMGMVLDIIDKHISRKEQ